MSETSLSRLQKVLAFSAVVEALTGLALMFDPALVVALLLGVDVAGVGILLGRCFGVALLALALACWPRRQGPTGSVSALQAMLLYNALIALYLAYLGRYGHFGGLLLWPAAGLHAAVAIMLVWGWRKSDRDPAARSVIH